MKQRQAMTIIAIAAAIAALAFVPNAASQQGQPPPPPPPPIMTSPPGAAAVEQRTPGNRAPAQLIESFDGMGIGFEGPQGTATANNPSDNSLAVGPDHVFQTVNSRMAIYTKKGKRFDATGRALYGPVPTNTVFKDFGGACEANNNGDAVVRYDQLADRWLIVMPIFRRAEVRPDQPAVPNGGEKQVSVPGRRDQPGPARTLFVPAPEPPPPPGQRGQRAGAQRGQPGPQGPYSMCYAISTGPDPLGSYYRYEFLRPLFPDYPRPAIWRDGYYVPTSTGDEVIQKHACVVERDKMLKGEPAGEQCIIVDGVNFLNNADIDGKALPPAGAPNVMMATGGTQLKNILQDDVVFVWKFHVDWKDPSKTALSGPERIKVAPYHYLCGGQLTNCVPQPGIERRLDAQGDKIMARLVYRRIGDREMIVAVHSVNTSGAAGGVRWYEFRIDRNADVQSQLDLAERISADLADGEVAARQRRGRAAAADPAVARRGAGHRPARGPAVLLAEAHRDHPRPALHPAARFPRLRLGRGGVPAQSVNEVQETYGVDVSKSHTSYERTDTGTDYERARKTWETGKSTERPASTAATPTTAWSGRSSTSATAWSTSSATATRTSCASRPSPTFYTDRFWPWYLTAFNEIDGSV